jgi:hypothetical protein
MPTLKSFCGRGLLEGLQWICKANLQEPKHG